MNRAADFREMARNALQGNWRVAVLTGFVASLIGATITGGGNSVNIDSDSGVSLDGVMDNAQVAEFFEKTALIWLLMLGVLLIWALVTVIIGGAGKLGYAKFNLNLIDGRPALLSDLFSQFDRLGTGFCMNFLISLYTSLWSLLFVIPGIVKSYSYAMTPYILAEHPEMTANQAITESRRIMDGNKGRLFCLEFSFIGWSLLAAVPILVFMPLALSGGIGLLIWLALDVVVLVGTNLFLIPYMEAARAAFYREVSYVPTVVQTPPEQY